jgi:hypothetical protein
LSVGDTDVDVMYSLLQRKQRGVTCGIALAIDSRSSFFEQLRKIKYIFLRFEACFCLQKSAPTVNGPRHNAKKKKGYPENTARPPINQPLSFEVRVLLS